MRTRGELNKELGELIGGNIIEKSIGHISLQIRELLLDIRDLLQKK